LRSRLKLAIKAKRVAKIAVLKPVINHIAEPLDQAIICFFTNFFEKPVSDTHSVKELAWIIQMQVACEPNPLAFDDPAKTSGIGVVIERLRYFCRFLFRRELLL